MESAGTTPVKYGQCWVFSAVVVTSKCVHCTMICSTHHANLTCVLCVIFYHSIAVCRALGIPCRSVTNFVSAHDTNDSMTIDRFFNEDGDELTSKDDPSIGVQMFWSGVGVVSSGRGGL